MLECLKKCFKSVSKHAKSYWKSVLEHPKIVCKKVEKKLKEQKNVFRKFKNMLSKNNELKIHPSSQIRPQKIKLNQHQQHQQTYVKNPEQECSRSKKFRFIWPVLVISKQINGNISCVPHRKFQFFFSVAGIHQVWMFFARIGNGLCFCY